MTRHLLSRRTFGSSVLACWAASLGVRAADKPTAKEALRGFNDLIGSWRGTGEPEGTRQEKQRGFWIETMSWEWGFKGQDAWLQAMFEKSKHFTKGELRYLPEKDAYQFTVSTPAPG